ILAGRSFTSADFASAAATNAAQKARDADAENANPASSPASPSPTALDEAYYHSAPVPIVVNESFAREYLENKSPVGLHMGNADRGDIPNPGPGYTIVGVVGDTKYAQLRRKTAPIIFLPLVSNSAHFELRIAANPTALAKNVREIVRLVIGQGILLALIGAAIGIAAAVGVTRFMSAMLYDVRANDPLTMVAVAALLILVAFAACYIPARRAMKVDPMVALRYE